MQTACHGVKALHLESHYVLWTGEPMENSQAVVWVTLNLPKHAIRSSLKALIGYSCGVLFVYHRITTASLRSAHLIFIHNMKAGDSGIFALYFCHRAQSRLTQDGPSRFLVWITSRSGFLVPLTPPSLHVLLNNSVCLLKFSHYIYLFACRGVRWKMANMLMGLI